jgi:DNA mismatch repair protein MutL
MKIKKLSEKTINRIAAGEVVERPLAVVKELVENAIDAGAKSIRITTKDGGRNLIEVTDNGCGMSKRDLSMALERHATSKLREDDINNIMFFGFRGEALPSIASVSRMKIISKADGEEAFELIVSGGDGTSIQPASRNVGTTVEVRDLFTYTPTRLKFLKSERAENAAIVDLVERIAFQHCAVEFGLIQDDKKVCHFPAMESINWLQRASMVFGKLFSENSNIIEFSHEGITLIGLVGVPTYNHKTSSKIYHYVNGRMVKDKLLVYATKAAYQNLMPGDRYPALAIDIKLDPREVDVNVHPTKAEIRFQNEGAIRAAMIKGVRHVIANTPIKADSSMSQAMMAKLHKGVYPTIQNKNLSEQIQSPFRFNYTVKNEEISPFNNSNNVPNKSLIANYYNEKKSPLQDLYYDPIPLKPAEQSLNDIANDFEHVLPASSPTLGIARCQVAATYIIAEAEDGIIIIDQHAAHERIVLEKLKLHLAGKSSMSSQSLLVPAVVELNPAQVGMIYDHLAELRKLGFHLDRNGATQVVVRSVPVIMEHFDVNQAIVDIAEALMENNDLHDLEAKFVEIIGNIACRTSIKAGRKLSSEEMNNLIRSMEATPLSSQCNHGRPTFAKISISDLNKLFERE